MPADELSTGGVPVANRPMPGTGSYTGPMANWSRWPNQPQIGWRSVACRSRRTNRNAGAPGPALRYLYVQPTASSTRASRSRTGTAPAECERSQTTWAS